jgi:hypothetical protein
MDRNFSAVAIRALLIALAAGAIAPAAGSKDADTTKFLGQESADPAASVPIVLAQGRCFNRRCF